MRPTEARWIAQQLATFPRARVSPLINIGSSTAEFREQRQPHIDALVFAPLRAAGLEVIHTDLKEQPGVEIAGDLLDPAVQERLRARRPRAALCSNLLEHVPEPAVFARAITSVLGPDAIVIVTVPRSYPYHADPIDTGFRPSPDDLVALFEGCTLIRGEVVADSSYGRDLWRQGARGLVKGVRGLAGALRPRGDVGRTQRDVLRWMFRPFTTTCVVLASPSSPG
jgi:hypothetical protein